MNRQLKNLFIFTLALLSQWAAADMVPLDKVAAIVDEDVIMESELQQGMRAVATRMQSQNVPLPPLEVLREQVLNQLVVQNIQLQMAKRRDITVPDAQLDETIVSMRQANNASADEFARQLAAEGLDMETFREEIRKEIMVQQIQRGFMGARVKVSEQDIDNFLNSKAGQFWKSPQYNIKHILIAVSGNAGDGELRAAEEKARDIYQQAVNGTDFSNLAISFSAGQNALKGGDLGWRKTEELPDLFANQLQGKQTGYITQPFRSGAGFHILKVQDQRGGGELIVEQTLVRHILLQPSEILSDEQAKAKLTEIRQQVLAGADFGDMAKEYSEDLGSKMNDGGGSLGWSTPDRFVPAFAQTMTQTKAGEVSPPFRSQFGWHILKVDERRQQDMSQEMIRDQAANLLRNRKMEEELPRWLQQIRDDAFVQIKGEEVAASSGP